MTKLVDGGTSICIHRDVIVLDVDIGVVPTSEGSDIMECLGCTQVRFVVIVSWIPSQISFLYFLVHKAVAISC